MMKKKMLESLTALIGIIIIFFSMICIAASYILAFIDKQVNENLSIAFVGTILGSFMTMALKSVFEKMSANKYQIDRNTGKPFECENTEES